MQARDEQGPEITLRSKVILRCKNPEIFTTGLHPNLSFRNHVL